MKRIPVYVAPGAEAPPAAARRSESRSVLVVRSTPTASITAPDLTSRVLHRLAETDGQVAATSFDPNRTSGLLVRLRESWTQLARLSRRMKDADRVHLVFAPAQTGWIEPMALLVLARLLGKFTLLDSTSFFLEPAVEKWPRILVPLLKCADRILVGSPASADRLQAFGLPTIGVGPFPGLPDAPVRDFSALQPRLLSVQPLEITFNVVCQLRAFRIVKQKYPRAELTIVGRGPQRAALEQLVAADRLTGVTIIESADPDRLDGLYRQAELFLCSASFDDLPSAPFEALGFGLPVVTTDAGALPDFLTDRQTALMVPLNDHATLADRILTLTESPELAGHLSYNGRLLAEHLRRRFTRRFFRSLYFADSAD